MRLPRLSPRNTDVGFSEAMFYNRITAPKLKGIERLVVAVVRTRLFFRVTE